MITHLVLSGGGIKGFAYLGILRYLYIENMVKDIKYVAGSSIGAFFCMILALKIPIDILEEDLVELLKEVNNSNILSINKDSFAKLMLNNGFSSIRIIMKPIIKYLKDVYGIDDITFIDFVKKTGVNLYVNATNVNTGERKIFCVENTPNISVIDSVVASMSVPILFEPVSIEDDYYVDGVLSNDLPLDIFKNVSKNNTLAILLMIADEYNFINKKGTEYNFLNYNVKVFHIMINNCINQSIFKYKDRDDFYLLKLDNMPYNRAFKFTEVDNDLKVILRQEDLDNLILKGFIDISNYMKKRYAKNDDDI